MTQTSNGSIYVRYLPPGEKVGVKTPYLTVATYPFPGAYAAIKKVARQKGVKKIALAGGGLAEFSRGLAAKRPCGVPGRRLPGRGLRSDTRNGDRPRDHGSAGRVREAQVPTAGAAATAAKPSAVSPAELKSLAASLGHPLYWVGAKNGYTYEVTRTQRRSGLHAVPAARSARRREDAAPHRCDVSVHGRFRRDPGAGDTEGRSRRSSSTTAGARSSTRTNPSSIHLAYPASDYEIEVFDPSPARARRIVSSGQVRPTG